MEETEESDDDEPRKDGNGMRVSVDQKDFPQLVKLLESGHSLPQAMKVLEDQYDEEQEEAKNGNNRNTADNE